MSSGLVLAPASTSRVEDVEVDQLVVITHRNALQGQDEILPSLAGFGTQIAVETPRIRGIANSVNRHAKMTHLEG